MKREEFLVKVWNDLFVLLEDETDYEKAVQFRIGQGYFYGLLKSNVISNNEYEKFMIELFECMYIND